jgi:hypothetical protein
MAGSGAVAAGVQALPMGAKLATIASGYLAPVLGGMAAGYSGLRGVDAALGNRNPVKEFQSRFSGLNKTSAAPGRSFNAETAQARQDELTARKQARVDAAQARQSEKDQAKQETKANTATRALAESALRSAVARGKAEGQITKRDETAQARSEANQASEARGLLRQTVARGRAEAQITKQQEAAQRRQDGQVEAEAHRMNRRYDQEQAKDLTSARREAYRMNDEINAKAAEAKRLQDIQKKLEAKRAAQNEKLATQGEANLKEVTDRVPMGVQLGARKTAAAMKAAQKLASKPQKAAKTKATNGSAEQPKAAKGAPKAANDDVVTIDGVDHLIPSDVKHRDRYISSMRRKQAEIKSGLDNVIGEGVDVQTGKAVLRHTDRLRTARSRADAKRVIEAIVEDAAPEDRAHIKATLNDNFLSIWKKAE